MGLRLSPIWLSRFRRGLPQWRCRICTAELAALQAERCFSCLFFCVDLPSADAQEACRATVSRIRQLHLHRQEFVEQAEALRATNPVYRSGVSDINRELLAEWFGNEDHIFAMNMFVLRVLQRFQPRCRSLLFHLRSSTASLLFPLAKLGRVLFVKPDLPRRLKLVSRPDRRRPSVAICRRPVSWPWSRRFRILILVAGKFQ